MFVKSKLNVSFKYRRFLLEDYDKCIIKVMVKTMLSLLNQQSMILLQYLAEEAIINIDWNVCLQMQCESQANHCTC